jgi:hypothetical protein
MKHGCYSPGIDSLRIGNRRIYVHGRKLLRQARVKARQDVPPFIQIGRTVRYRSKDLAQWIEMRNPDQATADLVTFRAKK